MGPERVLAAMPLNLEVSQQYTWVPHPVGIKTVSELDMSGQGLTRLSFYRVTGVPPCDGRRVIHLCLSCTPAVCSKDRHESPSHIELGLHFNDLSRGLSRILNLPYRHTPIITSSAPLSTLLSLVRTIGVASNRFLTSGSDRAANALDAFV
jgi:hypothetical protein